MDTWLAQNLLVLYSLRCKMTPDDMSEWLGVEYLGLHTLLLPGSDEDLTYIFPLIASCQVRYGTVPGKPITALSVCIGAGTRGLGRTLVWKIVRSFFLLGVYLLVRLA